jgi:tol-pal system protein YbgF
MRLLMLSALGVSACATGSAATQELQELRAEVRALREDNARLEGRLANLERQKAISQAISAPMPAPVADRRVATNEPKPSAEVPSLTVVKLKPKHEAAPKIQTDVEVLEPSPEVIAAMKKIEAENRGEPAEPPEIDAATGDEMFDHAMSSLKTGNITGGVQQLQKFAQEAPQHAKADNALYFSGVGLMGLNDYEDAARAFEEVQTRYPAGDAVQDSMLKLAECRLKLNKPAEARAVYQKIVSRFPGTAAADQAQGRLTQLR